MLNFCDIMIPDTTGFSAYHWVLYIWPYRSDFRILRRSETPMRCFIHCSHLSHWSIDHTVRYIYLNYREKEGIGTRPHMSFCLSVILVSSSFESRRQPLILLCNSLCTSSVEMYLAVNCQQAFWNYICKNNLVKRYPPSCLNAAAAKSCTVTKSLSWLWHRFWQGRL